jgi:hypothetical protein
MIRPAEQGVIEPQRARQRTHPQKRQKYPKKYSPKQGREQKERSAADAGGTHKGVNI